MSHRGTLLIVNHTSDFVVDYEEAVRESGFWDFATIPWLQIDSFQGDFDAILLLGLSGRQELGFGIILMLREKWPNALLYVATQHGRSEVFNACLAYGATRVFHSEKVREVVLAIEKPPEP